RSPAVDRIPGPAALRASALAVGAGRAAGAGGVVALAAAPRQRLARTRRCAPAAASGRTGRVAFGAGRAGGAPARMRAGGAGPGRPQLATGRGGAAAGRARAGGGAGPVRRDARLRPAALAPGAGARSEEHTSELQS